MLQNASYTFLKNETKQSDYEKKKKRLTRRESIPRPSGPLTCKGDVYP